MVVGDFMGSFIESCGKGGGQGVFQVNCIVNVLLNRAVFEPSRGRMNISQEAYTMDRKDEEFAESFSPTKITTASPSTALGIASEALASESLMN